LREEEEGLTNLDDATKEPFRGKSRLKKNKSDVGVFLEIRRRSRSELKGALFPGEKLTADPKGSIRENLIASRGLSSARGD